MRSDIDIIHLSDLHFGQRHRYVGNTPFETLLSKTCEDLDILSDRFEIHPSIIIITGDLAERSVPDEYKKVREFLNGLLKKLSLDSSRVVIVPGNHDVNYELYEGFEKIYEAHGRAFDPPYFEKFENFKEFYDDFYQGSYVFSDKLYNIFSYPELGLIIAGLNSCFEETPSNNFGSIGLNQIHEAGREIDAMDSNGKYLRIAAFHHNFFRESRLDMENLKDADQIRVALGQYRFSILLHGHRHVAAIQQTFIPDSIPHTVICTGSAGLDRSHLPEYPNQYQVLRISPKSITLLMRRYSSKSIGRTGPGRWEADTSIHDDGKVEVPRNLALW